MKKVIGCIVKCVLIILMYFAIQFLMNMVINIPADYRAMADLVAQGMDPKAEETIVLYNERCEEITQANLGLVNFIASAVSVTIIFGIYVANAKKQVRKEGIEADRKEVRRLARKELGVKKIGVKKVLLALVAGAGLAFFINGVLNMIPIPEWLMNSYSDASSSITNLGFIGQLFGVVLAPAVAEEVLFRGMVFGNMKKVMPVWVAVLISSALFGIVHGNLLWFTYTFVMGIILACADLKLGSIIPGMIMHFIFNLTGVIFEGMELPAIVFVVLAVLGIGALVAFFMNRSVGDDEEYVQPEGHGEVVG